MSTIEDTDLEAALTGAPGADAELTALVRDVRAQAPVMTTDFAARLEDRVAALPTRPPRWAAALTPRRLLPAFAVATLLIALATAGVVLRERGGKTDARTVSAITKEAPTDQSSAASSGAASVARGARRSPTAPAAAPVVSPTRLGSARKVQRDADLTLTTSPGDLQDVADRVVSTTQDVDGVVARSSVDVTDGGGSASFTLRIPTRRLDDALKRLSDLAHVGSLRQGSTDITGSFVSAADRLSDARAERRALLKALEKATTPNAIASLRSRLRFNRSEIAALKGDLQALRRRADLATVNVALQGRGPSGGGADTGGASWTPRDAARDALRVLEVAAGVVLVAAAVLVPLAVLALLAALTTRVVRRRGREQALDAG